MRFYKACGGVHLAVHFACTCREVHTFPGAHARTSLSSTTRKAFFLSQRRCGPPSGPLGEDMRVVRHTHEDAGARPVCRKEVSGHPAAVRQPRDAGLHRFHIHDWVVASSSLIAAIHTPLNRLMLPVSFSSLASPRKPSSIACSRAMMNLPSPSRPMPRLVWQGA